MMTTCCEAFAAMDQAMHRNRFLQMKFRARMIDDSCSLHGTCALASLRLLDVATTYIAWTRTTFRKYKSFKSFLKFFTITRQFMDLGQVSIERAPSREARLANLTFQLVRRIVMRRPHVQRKISLRFERPRTLGACERPPEMHRIVVPFQVESRLKLAPAIVFAAFKVSDLIVFVRNMPIQVALLPANQHPALVARPHHRRRCAGGATARRRRRRGAVS